MSAHGQEESLAHIQQAPMVGLLNGQRVVLRTRLSRRAPPPRCALWKAIDVREVEMFGIQYRDRF
jgi:hypothetical protein